MVNLTRNFLLGRMNKIVDERLVRNGEYIDALNCRMASTEDGEMGVIENSKGNLPLSFLKYIDNTLLSSEAKCIGAIAYSSREKIFWFVHDPNFSVGETHKLDLIISINVETNILTYHVVSINDGSGENTTLNFNPKYLITGVNIIDDFLFFTDDYNPPRIINIKSSYPLPVDNIDLITPESLLVIKKPPLTSPAIQLLNTGIQNTFMEDRFICFAYRYKYVNGEYSATSQFTAPAFMPKAFDFNMGTYLNEGMKNLTNTVLITYNSGNEFVVGIDLLFKEAGSNVIKVIEKLEKNKLGLSNDTDYSYTFTDSKIFTILPDYEILRLYDNVPRFAKAQTIMSNRLVYGNYIEGYNLIDKNGWDVRFDYFTELISTIIGEVDIPHRTSQSEYSIDEPVTISDSAFYIDLTGFELKEGATIYISIRFSHAYFTGDEPFPEEHTEDVDVSFSYLLIRDYSSVYELATSLEFRQAIGIAGDIKEVQDACNGGTFTDAFNCAIPDTLGMGDFLKYKSGISADDQPIAIITSPSSYEIGFQILAMHWGDNLVSPPTNIYEYFGISYIDAIYQEISNTSSLHSNRGYEVGIVYMDDFLRSSTALVSQNNTVHIPCSACETKNTIRVTIPTSQRAPEWATRYKFVIKPDKENYETIYSNIFFRDNTSNATYFLLEGENSSKVEEGDRLIVKADTNGPMDKCAFATVLEKESKPENFLEIPSENDPTKFIYVPAGAYMKINANEFSTQKNELSVIDNGTFHASTDDAYHCPILRYPVSVYDGDTETWSDFDVPAGSRIKFTYEFKRKGVGGGNKKCEKRVYIFEKTFIASKDYDNFYDWFVGDGIGNFLNDGTQDVGGDGPEISNIFDDTWADNRDDIPCDYDTNNWRFWRNSEDNAVYLMSTGTISCGGIFAKKNRRSSVSGSIIIVRADSTIIFETEPTDAVPDIFFENDESFEIDSDGNHMGNTQNQDIELDIPAIIDTNFFNCFAFGNGVESYKIQDSVSGKTFNLGNRTYSVAAQDFKEADRFADITWSGVYNDETNLNKFNEFNLGIYNFKPLEDSFGEIQILDGRETDILVLQEDKISYVLVGKNILSDAAAGGTITSIPEVFGNQLARIENFGISNNPESYASWGFDRYFTDAKRGVVIQLKGGSYNSDGLKVVSDLGMRSWFRDLFNESFKTQKLGAFDPYMNEYVLSSNENELYYPEEIIPCGMPMNILLISGDEITRTIDLGNAIGTVTIDYNIISVDESITINIIYNGVMYSAEEVSSSGSITFEKDVININTVSVSVVSNNGDSYVEIVTGCPEGVELTIIQVCLTNFEDRLKYIHNQYGYIDGEYISPIQSKLIEFSDGMEYPLVSQYDMITGIKGEGGFPTDGSTVRIISNKFGFDNFDFNINYHKFRYQLGNVFYSNTPSDIMNLIQQSFVCNPIFNTGNDVFYGQFEMTAGNHFLYLIWDYRKSTEITLCYTELDDLEDICCNCDD